MPYARWIAAALLLVATSQAAAETLDVKTLGDDCLAAIAAGDSDRATELAAELVKARDVQFAKPATNAAQCLTSVTGEDWLYYSAERRIVRLSYSQARSALAVAQSDAETAARQAVEKTAALLSEAASRRDAVRALEVEARTLLACYRLLQRDEVAALTNPVCQPRFMEAGLDPD